jgi:hypothetical protein
VRLCERCWKKRSVYCILVIYNIFNGSYIRYDLVPRSVVWGKELMKDNVDVNETLLSMLPYTNSTLTFDGIFI